jgi:hypothetical protein
VFRCREKASVIRPLKIMRKPKQSILHVWRGSALIPLPDAGSKLGYNIIAFYAFLRSLAWTDERPPD